MGVEKLWRLQEVDKAIKKLSQELKQKELVLYLKDLYMQIQELEGFLSTAHQQIAQSEQEVERQEAQLRGLEEQKQVFEERLYSGKVNIPREIESVRNKIAEVESKINLLEEDILALMDKNEDGIQVLNQRSGQLELLKKTYKKGYRQYQQTKLALEKAREEAEEKKVQILKAIEEKLITRYKELQEKYKFSGIAKVEGNLCSGCKINIPVLQLKALKVEPELQYCEHCRRLIVYIDKE